MTISSAHVYERIEYIRVCEVCQRLRADDRTRHLSVVMMTASAGSAMQGASTDSGLHFCRKDETPTVNFDAHGGTIRVQDLPEEGCILMLELPLTSHASSTSAGPGPT